MAKSIPNPLANKKPTFFNGRHREWKAGKRRELAEAQKLVERLYSGATYTPAMAKIIAAREALREAQIAMSGKNWGH